MREQQLKRFVRARKDFFYVNDVVVSALVDNGMFGHCGGCWRLKGQSINMISGRSLYTPSFPVES